MIRETEQQTNQNSTETSAEQRRDESATVDSIPTPAMREHQLCDIDKFMADDKILEDLDNPQWLYENLILKGHFVVIAGPPGAGKSAIARKFCAEIASPGLSINYFNCDVAGVDARKACQHADVHGYKMLIPQMAKDGKSADDVVVYLQKLTRKNTGLDGVVFVLDSLKKFVDVNSKEKAKRAYATFRALTSKGATVILLGHTLKYMDDAGNYIFEGTGDLKADCDDMIYFCPDKRPDKSIIVTTKPDDKVRGPFEPITFTVSRDGHHVEQEKNVIDTATRLRLKTQRAEDKPVIDEIVAALQAGRLTQTELFQTVSRKRGKKVLDRYKEGNLEGHEPLWVRERGHNNAWLHRLV